MIITTPSHPCRIGVVVELPSPTAGLRCGLQATVYDDTHLEARVGVAVHFVNERTEHAAGGELRACAWVASAGWTRHAHGDACLVRPRLPRCPVQGSMLQVVGLRVLSFRTAGLQPQSLSPQVDSGPNCMEKCPINPKP